MLVSGSISLMGTTITVSLLADDAEALLAQVMELLKVYEQRFSANDDQSELMKVNHEAGKNWVFVHPELFELIALGKSHSLAPASHLNITIGPLVQTWRIGFSDARVPKDQEIKDALSLTDPSFIELDFKNQGVYLAKPGMKIDLGALAKGYIADRIADFLRKKGVSSALINLGGNVLTLGINEESKRPWRIGIQNPQETRGHHLALLNIQNQSVVTSGVYERSLTDQGETYHHILDRKTGYPLKTKLTSLTIVSDKSVDGEIWTTRLFGQEPAAILKAVEAQEGLEAFIITENNHYFYSSGLEPQIL
ncbi:thiamine biosynthesis protein ApbE [Streptococcus oricebi]|uniref:FAD:protein FMN transferase n=2 Tax=Streptococcus oricebi TaxID=1547447 RepID=A0ABS5B346_9STRE|nr:FAD:protein FMN transferase [Streptococcus oricebi]MBP2623242.1 thiamine biosynthesis protein ApbE [Streptococcus oricebi]